MNDLIDMNLKYIHSLQFNKCFKQIINPDHEYDLDNIYLI